MANRSIEKTQAGDRTARSKKGAAVLPTVEFEARSGWPKSVVIGVDEVGRGCLAGPVVAGASILPSVIDFDSHPFLKKVKDSKMVPEEVREELAPLIRGWALDCAVGEASVEEIDRLNIYHASHLAMARAVEALSKKNQVHILVDGNAIPKDFRGRATAIVQGDQKCLSIAAASIIAKVWRDQYMKRLHEEFPGYGFASHKGYSTPEHFRAIQKLGVIPAHRRSFAPVADRLQLSLI